MTADKKSENEDERSISPKRKLSDTETENDEIVKRMKSDYENEGCEQNNDVPSIENPLKAGEQNGQMKVGIASNSTGQSPMKVYAGCKICSKQFNGPQTYMAHLSSAGHKKKVGNFAPTNTTVETFKCEICNKTFSGPIPYEQHMISKVHRKNVTLMDLNKKFMDAKGKSSDEKIQPEASVENDTTEVNKQLSCEICSKKFSGLIPYDLHISSSSHANKVNALLFQKSASKDQTESVEKNDTAQPNKQLFCEICDKKFSGPIPYEIHVSSASHAKKVNVVLFEKAASQDPSCINDSETEVGNLPTEK